jgi:peroxiredoxin
VRDRLAEFGDAEIAVVTFTRQRNLAGYRSRFVAPLTVLADEGRGVYAAYGLPTPAYGGDFVIDGRGRLVCVFRAEGSDRPPVDDLLAAVREARSRD